MIDIESIKEKLKKATKSPMYLTANEAEYILWLIEEYVEKEVKNE